jgi:hypothetical protein
MLRRVLGAAAVVLGVVGLLLAVACLVAVWALSPEATRRAVGLAGTGESALGEVRRELAEAGKTVAEMEGRFESAGPLVRRLEELEQARLKDPRAREATVHQLQDLVVMARTFIRLQRGLLRAGERSREAASELGLPGAAEPAGPSVESKEKKLDELGRWVDEVERVSQGLKQGEADKVVDRVKEVYDRMGAVLGQAREQIRVLGERVEALEAEVARVRERLPVWVAWAKGVATALLLWSAWAQAALVAHGRRLWRSAAGG